MSKNPKRPAAAHPTYCQVVRLFFFHQDNSSFSPSDPSVGGVGPSPPAGAGAALAASKLTNNTTAAPDPATPTALGGSNFILNLNPPTGLEFNADSDIMYAGSSGANESNLTYLKWQTNSPNNQNNTLNILTIIEEVGNPHKVVITDLANIKSPRVISIPVYDIYTAELTGGEANPTKPSRTMARCRR